jgi:starch synthase
MPMFSKSERQAPYLSGYFKYNTNRMTPIKVLFLAAEAEPFIKVGGLADVAGTLPLELRNSSSQHGELDVRLVLPMHSMMHMDAAVVHVADLSIQRYAGRVPAQIYASSLKGLPVYFISGMPIDQSPSVYSSDGAVDREKYTFFSLAALEMLNHIDWQPDIVHANDWHTALALYAIKSGRVPLTARTVFTIHNLPFMGGEAAENLVAYGLPPLHAEYLPSWAGTQPLPLGLWSADVIVPVSPTYAQEIMTPEFGCGLDPYLRSRSGTVRGILNGLDENSFDPRHDPILTSNFSLESISARQDNKLSLQAAVGLPTNPDVPLLAMIGRIDQQKGVDIALATLGRICDLSWQFVLLGTGDPALEAAAGRLESRFPDRVRINLRFDSKLGRKIYAGADFFLMPSRYEPCGLAQMIAMRYGCVPVVRATGGLKDTVQEALTGFLFTEATPEAMAEAIERALQAYSIGGKLSSYQSNGMVQDFSWSRSATRYIEIYSELMRAAT